MLYSTTKISSFTGRKDQIAIAASTGTRSPKRKERRMKRFVLPIAAALMLAAPAAFAEDNGCPKQNVCVVLDQPIQFDRFKAAMMMSNTPFEVLNPNLELLDIGGVQFVPSNIDIVIG